MEKACSEHVRSSESYGKKRSGDLVGLPSVNLGANARQRLGNPEIDSYPKPGVVTGQVQNMLRKRRYPFPKGE
jgi:hypothetical protein